MIANNTRFNKAGCQSSVVTKQHKKVRKYHPTILEQIRLAWKNKVAASTAAIFGGFVPVATYTLAHYETEATPLMWLPVSGGLAFSAITLAQWGRQVFGNWPKSIGFVVLIESVMTFSATNWLALTALTLLAAINAIACSVNLVMESKTEITGNH